MISLGIELNLFLHIRLILEAKFGDDTLDGLIHFRSRLGVKRANLKMEVTKQSTLNFPKKLTFLTSWHAHVRYLWII